MRLPAPSPDLLGGTAAITTASETRFGVALDDPPPGWWLANPQHHKRFAAALLDGAAVRLIGRAPWLAALPVAPNAGLTIRIDEQPSPGSDSELVYVPRTLALGVGCERGIRPDELIALATGTLAARNLSTMAVAGVFSLDLKSDEAAVLALGRALAVPVRFFSAEELAAETPRLANPSEIVRREVGVAGVAEAAALAAAGPHASLLVEKTRSARATLAVARAPDPLVDLPGRRRGRLSVVGLGPGGGAWRSPAAVAALTGATDWVGYGLYLDLAADLATTQQQHRFPLGAEADRVRHALMLAGRGGDVALLCSGDAAIYGMASLAAEMLDEGRSPAVEPSCRRVALEIIPGISAFQAASAAAGALIGHDFCCISLSDLLTPWAVIENRLRAAAAGDFVVALYNPRSLRRRDQLDRAIAILAEHRPPATPVVIGFQSRTQRRAGHHRHPWRFRRRRRRHAHHRHRRVAAEPQLRARRRQHRRLHAARLWADAGRTGMTVHFIGAGPGAPDLITLRGHALIRSCPVCLYAGSLVPAEIVAAAPPGARVLDTVADAPRRHHRRDGGGPCKGRGCCPRPFRRSLALWRHSRADAPPRSAGHSL